jgi:chaperone modulatory protein CbpM
MTMDARETTVFVGTIVGVDETLTLEQLVALCDAGAAEIMALVEEGVLDAASPEPRFDALALRRARLAMRLQRDLGVNLAGVALVIELLERIERLERDPGR